jgi:hypothetical protein
MTADLNYLRAELHRAMQQGARSMNVGIEELSSMLATIDSNKEREAREFQGKLFGFVKIHKARAMLSGSRVYLTVSHVKHADFAMPLYFTGIPEAP